MWVPKVQGQFLPKALYVYDEGAYGTIDEFKNGQNARNWTEIDFAANVNDTATPHLLLALLGTEYSCVKFPVPGSITGTYTEGETITESVSSATGTLRRADVGGSSKALYVVPVSGTFTGGQTLTGGSSGATCTGGTIESASALRWHLFRRNNTNNPVTYTIHGSDPVSSDYAAFCTLDTLRFECQAGNIAKHEVKFVGQKLVSESAPTPSYTAPNYFMAKYATFKTASAFSGLDAASAVNVERVTFEANKNVLPFQAFGSTNVTSFFNQLFSVKGEMTLLYNATTQRDWMINTTKQAMRLTLANTDVTIGSSSNPTLQFDLASVAFTEFGRPQGNKDLIKQTIKFTAEYDLTTAQTVQVLVANTTTAAY